MKTIEQKIKELLRNPKTVERMKSIMDAVEALYAVSLEHKPTTKCYECGREMKCGDTVYSRYVDNWPNGGSYRHYCSEQCAITDARRCIDPVVLTENMCDETRRD